MKAENHGGDPEAVRRRLVDLAGRTAGELGFGRILGQIVAQLYFSEPACSMDELERDLGLSKAAVSTAARQLESLGLVKRVWKPGDRRAYYQTADNLATVLQEGVFGFLNRKVGGIRTELTALGGELEAAKAPLRADARFLRERLRRAEYLAAGYLKWVNSRLVRHLRRLF